MLNHPAIQKLREKYILPGCLYTYFPSVWEYI